MDPQRFLDAQAPVWDDVMSELKAGRKASHWMWYIFPQLAELGRSARAQHFGLTDGDEARAYDAHPVLGARLRDALAAAMASGEHNPVALLGPIDALKLRSCLTLFAECATDPAPYRAGLRHFYGGAPDPLTLDALGR